MRMALKLEWLQCDRCHKKVQVCQHEYPAGWTTRQVHDCGMTGYTRKDDLCPDCSKKQ